MIEGLTLPAPAKVVVVLVLGGLLAVMGRVAGETLLAYVGIAMLIIGLLGVLYLVAGTLTPVPEDFEAARSDDRRSTAIAGIADPDTLDGGGDGGDLGLPDFGADLPAGGGSD